MKKKRNWWIWLIVAAVAVVAAVLLLGGGGGSEVKISQEIATTGTITSFYSFTGNVKVEKSQSLAADGKTTVREVYVAEGDRVEKEDRLLRLANGETLKAGIGGEVDKLHVGKDDNVAVGDPLMDIVDFDNLSIEMKVDELDVPAVTVGKAAQATVNALNVTFDTTVTRLQKQATQEGDISYYTATLALSDVEGVLPGMQVDVKIMNAYAENVTLISMDALQFSETNEPYVMVQSGNGIQNKPVTLGVNDGVKVEIQDGIRSGETILYFSKDTSSITDMFMGGPQMGMPGGIGGGAGE